MSPSALLRVITACVLLSTATLHAQSYQTSFSDVKFDRAKGPATFTAGIEVDAASGAASINLPFGPGIGERGLKFRPVLSMRMAPQLAVSSVDENYLMFTTAAGTQTWGTNTLDTLYQRSFGSASFSPGALDLGGLVSDFDDHVTTWSLPGGGGGRVLGRVPSGVTGASVQALLPKFGLNRDGVAYLPGQTDRSIKEPFIQMGSDGSLVVGLRLAGGTGALTDEVCDSIQAYPPTAYQWDFPRRMLVIQGDVAYEFHYVNHTYYSKPIPYLANSNKRQLYNGHYLLSKIRNRYQESIDFNYDADGIGYTATWSTNPNVIIQVQVVGSTSVAAGQPCLLTNSLQATSATRIRISYQGMSQPLSSFLLEVCEPRAGQAFHSSLMTGPMSPTAAIKQAGQRSVGMANFDSAMHSVQPLRLVQEATGEEISFSYGTGPISTWGVTTITPTTLKMVTFPTRTVTLAWQPYRFRMNYNPEAWGGYVPSSRPGRPAIAYGVTLISDSDGTQSRTLGHERVVPTSNWATEAGVLSPLDQWADTTFYGAITHQDGSFSVHRFVSPPAANGISGSDGMQNLSFIKTLEREVRYYLPGVDWRADLGITSPAASSAYKWVVRDRFDVRTVGAPDGSSMEQAVPYPTRVRTWDKESQLLTIQETTDWDSSAFGWKSTHTTTAITPSPTLTVEYQSRAKQGLAYSPYPATQGLYRRIDKTFEPNAADWILARVKTERTTTLEDNTGTMAPGVAIPDAQPLVAKSFSPDINRVESVEISNVGAPTVTTAFTFQGTSGLLALELKSAYLTSPGLLLSGQLGVSDYGYDANGYLNAITQKPNEGTVLTVTQVADELGRPQSQTDVNGTVKRFTRDAAGRLSGVTSSDNEVATTITYDDTDHRGITVSHGAQVTTYRYNGFGELILEGRTAPDGVRTHRLFGYDSAGRKTGETVWQPGVGTNHEAEWFKPNLTRSFSTTITTTTPAMNICKRYGVDANGEAVCLSWQRIPASTTTQTIKSDAAYAGSAIAYDGRGRVTLTQDANGVATTTEYFGPTSLLPGSTGYSGPIRKVSVGPQVKWFENDAGGRFVRLTTSITRYADPLRTTATTQQVLRTEYRYDGGDRIREDRQHDEAGRIQTRTWAYNNLGWLTALGQPESGITAYSGFTVAGKPTVTSYAGRIVRTTPDWMGRPVWVWSDDGTVSQTLVYDTVLNGKGKLTSSSDGPVTTRYTYGGQGNRLDSLITTLPVQGVPQSFIQTFGFDTHGNRTAGNTSHAGWTQSYHLEAGLPDQLRYGAAPVASTPWTSYDAVSWGVLDIAYGNGAHSAFTYDSDQARLTGITHGPANAPFAKWNYTWDPSTGNLARENDLLTGSFDQYTYDELNRLVVAVVQSSTYGEQLQQFDYDAFGNRTSSNLMKVAAWSGAKGASNASTTASGLSNVATSQVVNAAFAQGSTALLQNRLPATTATGVPTGAVYDAQGNLTQVFEKPTSVSPAVVSMTYDALGRVLSVANTRTSITERYQYTAEGLRTGVQEYSGATLIRTRVNVYNDQRQLVAQYEKAAAGALTWKRDILYLGTREAAEIDAAGMHVTMVDHLGSPRVVVGPSGTVEARQKFLPFGEFLEQSGTFKTAKGYTNHEQTDSSGLIYMQARFYHPGFGRFTAPDPARDQHFDNTQSWNIYSYVRNNPIMSTDPTGMLADQLNATQTMGPQGAMSGSGDYSFMWGNDTMELSAEHAVAQDVVAQKDTNPPYDTTSKVPLPLPAEVDLMLREMAPKLDEKMLVTATTNGEHNPGSAHSDRLAVDLKYPKDPAKMLKAAAESGAKFGLDEKKHPTPKTKGAHIHLQLRPGRGGSRGDLPKPGGSNPATRPPAHQDKPTPLRDYMPSTGGFPLGSWS